MPRAGGGSLEMNESACELDQAFVKVALRPRALRQPKIFEHVMGFIEKVLVE